MKLLNITRKGNLLVVSLLSIILITALLGFSIRHSSQKKTNEWHGFQQYMKAIRTDSQNPLYANTYTSGCYEGDKGYEYAPACNFYDSRFYILEDDFRKTATAFAQQLNEQGYHFKSENVKYNFETSINNKNLADDLSNGVPLTGIFVNPIQGVEARLVIGDKKRVRPAGLPANLVSSLSDNQLMAVLTFEKSYK